MIADLNSLAERRIEWAAVQKLCANAVTGHALPGLYFTAVAPEGFHNLPLVLAYSVLDQVLSNLMDQGTFLCSRPRPPLGAKLTASLRALPWCNYYLVNAGKEARNSLAHNAVLVPRSQCLTYISAIETEFKAWHIL
jgi:hypothetical protein